MTDDQATPEPERTLEDLPKDELRERAESVGIDVKSDDTKPEIADKLREYAKDHPPPVPRIG